MNGTEKWLLVGALILTVGLTFYAVAFGRKQTDTASSVSRDLPFVESTVKPSPASVSTQKTPYLLAGIDGKDRNIATVYEAYTISPGYIVVFETENGKLTMPIGSGTTFSGALQNYYIKLSKSVSPSAIIVAQLYNKSASQSGEYVSVARTQVVIGGLDK